MCASMYDACMQRFSDKDAAILTAAVADYRPETKVEGKMKKMDQKLQIQLEPTQDILAALGNLKQEGQLVAGFSLETSDGKMYAEKKSAVCARSLRRDNVLREEQSFA